MLVFSHPRHRVGGIQILIYNLAKFITQNQLNEIALIDYHDGFIKKILDNEAINYKFIPADSCKPISMSDDDIYVFFGDVRNGLLNGGNKKGKIFLYQVFPTTVYDSFGIRMSINKRSYNTENLISQYLLNSFLDKLLVNNAFAVMDGANLLKYKKLRIDIKSVPILPIPIQTFDDNQYDVTKNREILNISYIGRSNELIKVLPLKRLLLDLKNIQYTKFNIHIITNDKKEFIDLMGPFDFNNYPHHIAFHEGLFADKLTQFLKTTIDLAFAMGTALLDTAKLGIPTIILDPSNDELPANYKYRWLFETTDNSLGIPLWLQNNDIGVQINEVIDIMHDERLNTVSTKCFHYVNRNHSIDNIGNRFHQYTIQSKQYLFDLNLYYKFFKIKKYVGEFIKIKK